MLKVFTAAAFAALVPFFAHAQEAIDVKHAWVRATVGDMRTVAAYAVFENNTTQDDALLEASSSLAPMVQIHNTTIDENGLMEMREMERVELPKGHFVQLQPGAVHIMLMRVERALKPGDEIPLTFTFENAPKVNARATVYPVSAMWKDVLK